MLLLQNGGAVISATGGEITRLLNSLRGGDLTAEVALMALVYAELKRVAASYLRSERRNHTLQPTALVHETFLRLVSAETAANCHNRAQFFSIAATMMRRILVDYARRRATEKRGGEYVRVLLHENLGVSPDQPERFLALDEALQRLARIDPRQSRVVELRFFAGLKEEAIAELLGVSVRTVKRDWSMAKAWLFGELRQ